MKKTMNGKIVTYHLVDGYEVATRDDLADATGLSKSNISKKLERGEFKKYGLNGNFVFIVLDDSVKKYIKKDCQTP